MKTIAVLFSFMITLISACGNRHDHASDAPPPPGKTMNDTTVPQIMPGSPGGDTGTSPRPKDTAYLHHPGAKRAMDTATHLPNKD